MPPRNTIFCEPVRSYDGLAIDRERSFAASRLDDRRLGSDLNGIGQAAHFNRQCSNRSAIAGADHQARPPLTNYMTREALLSKIFLYLPPSSRM
jgi:hypothetical protein